MALYIATPIIMCLVALCVEVSLVAPQIPRDSPQVTVATPTLAPARAALIPVAAETPHPGALQPEPQVTNVIQAIRDAGRFGAIAGLLDGLQMKSLTPMTTWLLPNDQAFSGINYPQNVTKFLDYHVIRELFPFSRLMTLSVGTRIPTFLGDETAVVTSNLLFNYSIDNALVVVPDLYSDSTVAVHGINAVLDDATFNGLSVLPPPPAQSPILSQVPPSEGPSPKAPPSFPPPQPVLNITLSPAHSLSAKRGFCIALASALILLASSILDLDAGLTRNDCKNLYCTSLI